ncbi:MAG: peroxiredoxin-like family protein [Hymenobacter sp.]
MNTLENPNTLASQLQEKQRAWAAKADDTTKRIYEAGVADLAASGLAARALTVGDSAPAFTLPNARRQPVALADLLRQGPVVLTWYRGGWCPYCNLQLQFLQQQLPQFRAAGATLVALTPEQPDASLTTTEKNHLEFEVLTDHNNEVARRFGLVFTLNDELVQLYSPFVKLADYNGTDTNELPLAATYVIASDATIRYAFVDPDYRKRAEPADILQALKTL